MLVTVPSDDPGYWIGTGGDFYVFHQVAYWRDLTFAPETTNTSKVAVRVPISQEYTRDTVHQHMREANERMVKIFMGAGGRCNVIDTEHLSSVARRPEELVLYLVGSGWRLVGATSDESLWVNDRAGDEWQLIAPLAGESASSVRRLNEALSVLASLEGREGEPLLRDITSSRSDLIRLRTFPRTTSGTAPLKEAIKLASASRELLIAAAATTDDRKSVLGSRKPDRAVEYADSVAVSTEPGSFILAFEVDVEPSIYLPDIVESLSNGDALFPDPSPLFARRATERLMEASNAAAEAAGLENRDSAFTESVANGVSANFLEALASLGGVPGQRRRGR